MRQLERDKVELQGQLRDLEWRLDNESKVCSDFVSNQICNVCFLLCYFCQRPPVWRQTVHEGLRNRSPKTRWTDPHPPLSAACVGETDIPASGYQDIADDAPGTTTPEGGQPARNHSLLRLTDAYMPVYFWNYVLILCKTL